MEKNEFVKKYNEFINNLSLKNIRLNSIKMDYDDTFHTPAEINHTLEVSYKTSKTDLIMIKAKYCFEATSHKTRGKFNLDLCYEVIYQNTKKIDKIIFHKFAQSSLQLNLHPFVRQHVWDITMKAGFPPFILEAFKIFGDESASARETKPKPKPKQIKKA